MRIRYTGNHLAVFNPYGLRFSYSCRSGTEPHIFYCGTGILYTGDKKTGGKGEETLSLVDIIIVIDILW